MSGLNEMKLDGEGNLFISTSSRVRRVDAVTGVITTVAGGGSGDPDDGGPAVTVSINSDGIWIDSSGDLYIADGTNDRIRKVEGVAAAEPAPTPTPTPEPTATPTPEPTATPPPPPTPAPPTPVPTATATATATPTAEPTATATPTPEPTPVPTATPTPTPTPVPSLTSWGLIAMALAVSGLSYVMFRRQAARKRI